MLGPLTRDGSDVFHVVGDLTLKMPKDASFKLSARVSERRDIVSEFPLKYLSDSITPLQSHLAESEPGPNRRRRR